MVVVVFVDCCVVDGLICLLISLWFTLNLEAQRKHENTNNLTDRNENPDALRYYILPFY